MSRLTESQKNDREMAALDAELLDDKEQMELLGRAALTLLHDKKKITPETLAELLNRYYEEEASSQWKTPRPDCLPRLLERLRACSVPGE